MIHTNEIVLIHNNYDWYLPFVLFNAEYFNNDTTLSLICNNVNQINNINIIDINQYNNSYIDNFKNIYFHLSPNSYDYELFCFLRWFYLYEHMKRKNLNYVLYMDSDYLLFDNFNDYIKENPINYAAFSIPKQDFSEYYWTASGHISIWSQKGLQDFCDFIIKAYTEDKYIKLLKEKYYNTKNGGICDMTIFYLFWLEKENMIQNLLNNYNNKIHDHNINSPDNLYKNEFITRFDRKLIHFIKNKPYFILKNNKYIQARGIHCQGTGKIYIPLLYKGPIFDLFYKYVFKSILIILKNDTIFMLKKLFRPLKKYIDNLFNKKIN